MCSFKTSIIYFTKLYLLLITLKVQIMSVFFIVYQIIQYNLTLSISDIGSSFYLFEILTRNGFEFIIFFFISLQ
jgi:hypothetical protein